MSTESTALVIIPELDQAKKLALITPESALAVKTAYLPLFTTFLELEKEAAEIAVNSPIAAKALRLKLTKLRTSGDRVRKTSGEEARRYKEACDEIYNLFEARLVPVEERLRGIEEAEKRAAQEKAVALKMKRLAELAPFGQDNAFYDLANLPETQYQQLYGSQKVAHESKQAALKKEADDRAAAEQARLKREADLATENARLAKETADRQAALDKLAAETACIKAEADAKLAAQAKAAADEAARVKKVADDKAAKEKADRDTAEKAMQAERDRLKAIEDAKAKKALDEANAQAEAARKKADDLAAQEKARQAEIAAKKAEADEAVRRAATAPDTEKVLAFARAVEAIPVPVLSTNADLPKEITEQVGRFVKWLRSKAGKL